MALQSVTVSGFEGPLDLLLELMEAEKLDITQVSLAHVTDQYLERMRTMASMTPEDLAQFLVIAARLILLKSKRLLPQLLLTSEEEEGIVSLEAQLREYQKFRARARILRQEWLSRARLFAREGYLGLTVTFYPPPTLVPESLLAAITGVVNRLPLLATERAEAISKVVSLEERIQEIQQRVSAAAAMSFQEAVKGATKANVVVSFLALLELVKQRILDVEQTRVFQDILMRKRSSE